MSRHIQPKMIDFLDGRLKDNGLAQHAIEIKDARLLMTEAAKVCVGIREKTGNNDGPMVELIQKTIGGADNEPWCVSFVQTCIAYAEVKTGVKSPLVATESSREIWDSAPKEQRVKYLPLSGAIVVYADVGKYTGHAEIVLSCDGEALHDVGGNTTGTTDPHSQVDRNGNGCYYTVRSFKHPDTASRKLLGFLKPF